MATYASVVSMTQNATVRNQVKVAIQEVSQYITDGNGGQPLSINKLTNAFLALRNPDQFIDWFIFSVCLDTNVQAAQTDANIKAVIDAKWNKILG